LASNLGLRLLPRARREMIGGMEYYDLGSHTRAVSAGSA